MTSGLTIRGMQLIMQRWRGCVNGLATLISYQFNGFTMFFQFIVRQGKSFKQYISPVISALQDVLNLMTTIEPELLLVNDAVLSFA